jgi:hypothetical protein
VFLVNVRANFFHDDQMTDMANHPANSRRISYLNLLTEATQP